MQLTNRIISDRQLVLQYLDQEIQALSSTFIAMYSQGLFISMATAKHVSYKRFLPFNHRMSAVSGRKTSGCL